MREQGRRLRERKLYSGNNVHLGNKLNNILNLLHWWNQGTDVRVWAFAVFTSVEKGPMQACQFLHRWRQGPMQACYYDVFYIGWLVARCKRVFIGFLHRFKICPNVIFLIYFIY